MVLRVEVVDPEILLQPVFLRIAEELDRLRPNVRESESLGVRFPGNDVGRLEQEPEAFLVIEKYQLDLLALGDFTPELSVYLTNFPGPLLDTTLQFATGSVERFLGLLSHSDVLNNASDR